jgi:hypothetical protein
MSRKSSNSSTRPLYTIAAARKIAASKDRIPLDDAEFGKRKLLRKELENSGIDPKQFARHSLVMAVARGLEEENAIVSQDIALAEWKNLTNAALAAVKALGHLIKRSRFKLGDLLVLEIKQARANVESDTRESIGTTVGNIGQSAHENATRLKDAIVSGRDAAQTIANQAQRMALGVARRKHDPGEPFRRGFVIEMMKTWLLLTGRLASKKRSEVGNPFVSFADAGLQSINRDSDLPSCAGVVGSARKAFLELHKQGAFDVDVPDAVTVPDKIPGR